MWQEAENARRIDELEAKINAMELAQKTELADSAATEATLRVRLAEATLYDKVVMQWPCAMLLIAGAMRRGMRCDHD